MEAFIFFTVVAALILLLYLQKHDPENRIRNLKRNQNDIESEFFTADHYKLLSENTEEIDSILCSLASDNEFVSKFKSIYGNSDISSSALDILKFLIIYDAGQVVRRIRNDLEESSLEVYSLVFLSLILSGIESELTRNYTSSKLCFKRILNKQDPNYSNICTSILETVRSSNPVKVFASKQSQSWNVDIDFSIPMILKYFDNSLADKYSSTLYRFATILVKSDAIVTQHEEALLNEIYMGLNSPVSEERLKSLTQSTDQSNDSLEKVLAELDNLVGLGDVKNEVKTLVNYIRIQKEREKQGLKISPISYHCVFTGSPGTGKTTVARIVGRIYKHLGILKKGHLIEADRASLIGEFAGHTAPKVDRLIESALDGVLFIDEAYSLMIYSEDPYGREAIAALIKRIEDNRDRLVVILAGYTEEMHKFIDSNPGFRSRFNRYIMFADYSPEELMEIFELGCKNSDYKLSTAASEKILLAFQKLFSSRNKSFGNARLARNLFEETLENQANRISKSSAITKDLLMTIEADDFPDLG